MAAVTSGLLDRVGSAVGTRAQSATGVGNGRGRRATRTVYPSSSGITGTIGEPAIASDLIPYAGPTFRELVGPAGA
jgi:hypothetical protein